MVSKTMAKNAVNHSAYGICGLAVISKRVGGSWGGGDFHNWQGALLKELGLLPSTQAFSLWSFLEIPHQQMRSEVKCGRAWPLSKNSTTFPSLARGGVARGTRGRHTFCNIRMFKYFWSLRIFVEYLNVRSSLSPKRPPFGCKGPGNVLTNLTFGKFHVACKGPENDEHCKPNPFLDFCPMRSAKAMPSTFFLLPFLLFCQKPCSV